MRSNLKAARLAQRYLVKTLSQLVGLSPTGYCNIEKGRSNGSVEVWDKLSAIFGMSREELRRLDDGRLTNKEEKKDE